MITAIAILTALAGAAASAGSTRRTAPATVKVLSREGEAKARQARAR